MKQLPIIVLLIFLTPLTFVYSQDQGLKVFISVDMEGLSGVVISSENSTSGGGYGYFRRIMAEETNAAIEGAIEAGATEIIVRDSHGAKRNILPGMLHPKAKLLRGHTPGPENMMITIDNTFDAVIFIGYHAKAGTPDAIIEHTSTGNVMDFSINGVSLPEAGYNALIAGMFDVPVAFVAGDEAICKQVGLMFGDVETFATKQGIGASELGLNPKDSQKGIKAGVKKALGNLSRFKPFKLQPPYTMVLRMKSEEKVFNGSFFPGAERTGEWEVSFKSSDLLAVLNAFNNIK